MPEDIMLWNERGEGEGADVGADDDDAAADEPPFTLLEVINNDCGASRETLPILPAWPINDDEDFNGNSIPLVTEDVRELACCDWREEGVERFPLARWPTEPEIANGR